MQFSKSEGGKQVSPIRAFLRKNMHNFQGVLLLSSEAKVQQAVRDIHIKSVNLQFNTVGRWDDDMIDPPSDGPMFILID